ncbi:hypothetical protein FVEG_15112 [Fusarium verticillioides 7600]|uniref:Uncharacterized protein n=1 Tax=Gibberella moniliformis (strain M3125 / FGSC 7600) TaxID=334819 RepID=W7LL75_GIBM7|nr:hypothetical protein FVEG_15112 [Fusarium verticillioides 7600]EWG40148.1 hypothetical protein FVEG_15112 [Fusarium verticillioides 7600]
MSDSKEVMEEFELPRQSGLIGVYREQEQEQEQEQDADVNVSGGNGDGTQGCEKKAEDVDLKGSGY